MKFSDILTKENVYVVSAIAGVVGFFFIYNNNSKSADTSKDSESDGGWSYPYFQSAALPMTAQYDSQGNLVSGGNGSTQAPDSGYIASLSTITQSQLDTATRQQETAAGTSTVQSILDKILSTGASNVVASYDASQQGKLSVAVSAKAAVPEMPAPQPFYKDVPILQNFAKKGADLRVVGYNSVVAGYKNPTFNPDLNIWQFS